MKRRPDKKLDQWRAQLAADPELRARVDAWLEHNPKPRDWQEDGDAWAFLEMPFPFFTLGAKPTMGRFDI